jgi:hypothetical protein
METGQRLRTTFATLTKRRKIVSWTVRSWLGRSLRWTWRKLGSAYTVALPIGGILAGLTLQQVASPGLDVKTAGDLLLRIATVFGGFFTVAFALSVSLRQAVLNLYSPQHLVDYSYGVRQKLTFASIAVCVIGSLALGAYCTARSGPPSGGLTTLALTVGFGALGLALALLESQLRHGGEQLRPTNAIAFLKRRAEKDLRRLDAEARRLGELLQLERVVTPEAAAAWGYGQLRQSAEQVVVGHLAQLYDTAVRLGEHGDFIAAGYAIEAWGALLERYLKYRNDCSLTSASAVHLLAIESDSQRILDKALAQLNDAGIRFIRGGQTENARAVVFVYERLAQVASEVRFLNGGGENPILDQVSWYLDAYVKAAAKLGDIEVPFASANVFAANGINAIKARLAQPVYATCRQLDTIVALATRETTFLIQRCVDGYGRLLWALLTDDTSHRSFRPVLEALERAHAAARALALNNTTDESARGSLLVARAPLEELERIVGAVPEWLHAVPPDHRTSRTASLLAFADELYGHVRRAAEMARARDGSVDILPRVIFAMVRALVTAETDVAHRSAQLAENWVFLLTWVAHKQKPFADASAVLDAATTAARLALQLSAHKAPDELVLAAVKAHGSLAKRIIEQHAPSFGYDEPRSIVPLCFAAALAIKAGDRSLSRTVAIAIRGLEDQYNKKFSGFSEDGNPVTPPTSVVRELIRHDRDHFSRADPTVSAVYPLVGEAVRLLSLSDLDRAIWQIWGVVPRWSPIAEEVESRRRLYSDLLTLLSTRARQLASQAVG